MLFLRKYQVIGREGERRERKERREVEGERRGEEGIGERGGRARFSKLTKG